LYTVIHIRVTKNTVICYQLNDCQLFRRTRLHVVSKLRGSLVQETTYNSTRKLNEVLILRVTLPLPLPDDQGRRVIIQRLSIYNPEEVKLVDVAKEMMMKVDVMLEEDDRSIICGIVIILDYTNSTLAHVMQYNPSFVKKMITTFLVRIDICSVEPSLVYPDTCYTLQLGTS